MCPSRISVLSLACTSGLNVTLLEHCRNVLCSGDYHYSSDMDYSSVKVTARVSLRTALGVDSCSFLRNNFCLRASSCFLQTERLRVCCG